MEGRILDIVWDRISAYWEAGGDTPSCVRVNPEDERRMRREELYTYSQVLSSSPSGQPTVYGIPMKVDEHTPPGRPQIVSETQAYRRAA